MMTQVMRTARDGLSERRVWRVVEGLSRVCRLRRSRLRVGCGMRRDSGMATAEYAVTTLAACGLAAVLYKVVTGASVSDALESLIRGALDAKF